jgi:GT2 family glycosyltransferase
MANMRGRVFVSLDDDGEFAPDAVARVMAAFDEFPTAGAVMMNVVEREAPWYPDWEHGRRVATFPGGASALRREVLERCGYYDDLFLRQGEEYDLSIRMHERDFEIVYCPAAVMVHRPLVFSRETPRHRATEFVHKSLALYKHAPWSCVLTDAPRRTLGYAWLLTRMGRPWLMVSALGSLLRRLPTALSRREVQPRGYRRVRELTRRGG